MVRQNKLFEVALMKLVGSSEGIRPKYTLEQERALGLETNNYLIGFIDYPIQVTISAKKSKVTEFNLLEFFLLSGVFATETTETDLLRNVIDSCDKFKASFDQQDYTIVMKHSESNYLLTLEGKHRDVFSRLGLSLQALEMRTAGK